MPAVPQVTCWDHDRRHRHTDVTWTLRKGRQGDTLVIVSASSHGSAAPAVTTGDPLSSGVSLALGAGRAPTTLTRALGRLHQHHRLV